MMYRREGCKWRLLIFITVVVVMVHHDPHCFFGVVIVMVVTALVVVVVVVGIGTDHVLMRWVWKRMLLLHENLSRRVLLGC